VQDNPQQQAAQDVIDQVRDASMSWGFFQLVNHGVSQQLLNEHYEVMKK
jgi:isopenicillin N synthase-like dioxygenase